MNHPKTIDDWVGQEVDVEFPSQSRLMAVRLFEVDGDRGIFVEKKTEYEMFKEEKVWFIPFLSMSSIGISKKSGERY